MDKSRSLVEKHWPETSLAAVLLVGIAIAWANRKISADTAEIVDVITASLTIYVIILKDYFSRSAEAIALRQYALESRTGKISSVLEELSGSDLEHANEVVDSALQRLQLIPNGTLQLEPSSYYNELTSMLRGTKKGFHVAAVSSMPMERWDHDPRQINYFEENIKAVGKGVQIHRVFLIDKSEMRGDYALHVREIILKQRNAKITCHLVWRGTIRHDPALYEDFVLFEEANLVFTDEHQKADPTRVVAGFRISNPQRISKYRSVFKSLTETYCDNKALDELLR